MHNITFENMKKAWANVVKRPIDWEVKEEWNEFTDAEVEQLCEDGWDDIDYAAEPPKHNSEEEYMDWMEADHEEQYLKWLAESEIVDGGAA